MPWSSDEVIKAVELQGYRRKGGKGKRGSHRTWAKSGAPGELHNTVTIPLNKSRIPDGTLRSILRQLGISEDVLDSWKKH